MGSLCPLKWKCSFLITGLPRKSLQFFLKVLCDAHFLLYSTNVNYSLIMYKHRSKIHGLVKYSSMTLQDLRILICELGIIKFYHSGLLRLEEDHAYESVL